MYDRDCPGEKQRHFRPEVALSRQHSRSENIPEQLGFRIRYGCSRHATAASQMAAGKRPFPLPGRRPQLALCQKVQAAAG